MIMGKDKRSNSRRPLSPTSTNKINRRKELEKISTVKFIILKILKF